MSVINQVLNQLEQRGAHTAPDQTMVRAVPPAKRNFTLPLLALGLALIAGAAAWQWIPSRGTNVATESVVPQAGNSPGSDELEKSTPPHQAVAVAAVPIPSAGPGRGSVLAGNPPTGLFAPASRMSFELSSVPLPSSLRQDSGQALRNEKNIHSSNPVVPVQPARPRPAKAVSPKEKVAARTSGGASPMKQVSPAQQADAEFRKAVALMQQGRIADALAGYEAALRLDAGHDAARQALVALLLENKRGEEAERVLQERLKSKPEHTGFTMLLARLQVDRGAVEAAAATLEKSLPFANKQADYHAFLAALLQRLNRNEEAITHYQIVTQLAPGNGVWLMGYGISLQAEHRNADAKAAFKKALDTQTLSPDLQAFVQQKLKEL